MAEIQLSLFEKQPKTELSAIWEFVTALKETSRRTEKRLFGELACVKESLVEARAEIEQLKYKLEVLDGKFNTDVDCIQAYK